MRTEKVSFNFDITNCKKYNDMLLRFGIDHEYVEGDIAKINYEVRIDYFGYVEERLLDLINLIDDGVVVDCNLEVLEGGYCLIKSILLRMEELEKKIKNDKANRRTSQHKRNSKSGRTPVRRKKSKD